MSYETRYHQINAFIRAHLNELAFTEPGDAPDSPIDWVAEHFEGTEFAGLLALLYGLIVRGAEPVECARYALDQNMPLPFQGFEQLLYEAMILGLRDRGHSPVMVARLLEVIAVMADGAARLLGVRVGIDLPVLGRAVARA